jgi:Spy/CpxP family protein refolding chaperone
MKKFIYVALLAIVLGTPAFADDAAKVPAKKPVQTAPSDHKHDHMMAHKKDDCDSKHKMGDYHRHGHGMMADSEHDMMLEPDMFLLKVLTLSKVQQSQIHNLADELKHKNWATQGLINDESAKLRDLYEADKRDPAAIGNEYQKIFDLKRQMIEIYLETQNRIEETLTTEQRAKLKDARSEMYRIYDHE